MRKATYSDLDGVVYHLLDSSRKGWVTRCGIVISGKEQKPPWAQHEPTPGKKLCQNCENAMFRSGEKRARISWRKTH